MRRRMRRLPWLRLCACCGLCAAFLAMGWGGVGYVSGVAPVW